MLRTSTGSRQPHGYSVPRGAFDTNQPTTEKRRAQRSPVDDLAISFSSRGTFCRCKRSYGALTHVSRRILCGSPFCVLRLATGKRCQPLQNRDHPIIRWLNVCINGEQRARKLLGIDRRLPLTPLTLPPPAPRHHLPPPQSPSIQCPPAYTEVLLETPQSHRARTLPQDRQQENHHAKKHLAA